jgi:hypothetical protein
MHRRAPEAQTPVRAWRELIRIARPQHGLFLTSQALECGVSEDALRRRRERGEVEAWHHGVNALAGFPRTWVRKAAAALLAGGPDCALSHWSAAYIHGLLDVARQDRLDLTYPRATEHHLAGTRPHDSRYLTEADYVTVRGLRVTSVEWTITDLARLVPEKRLERIVLDAWRRHLTDPRRLLATVMRRPRFRGRRKLLAILRRADPRTSRTRSIYESDGFVAIRDAGLPLPEVDVEVRLDDGTVRYLDLGYVEVLLGIEVDSKLYHSIVPDVAADKARQEKLEEAGWDIMRVTTREIATDPAGFAEKVRARLKELGHPGATD